MKGRPEGSIVRNRIVHILKKIGSSYGYEIYKIYKKLFGNVHIRTIYYNLKKGIENEEIIVVDVVNEMGDYSWGNEVEKVYYTTGPYAESTIPDKDAEKIENISLKKSDVEIDWEKEIKGIVNELEKDIQDFKERKDSLSSQGRKLLKKRIKEKYKKLRNFSKDKISEEKLKELIKDVNPHTL